MYLTHILMAKTCFYGNIIWLGHAVTKFNFCWYEYKFFTICMLTSLTLNNIAWIWGSTLAPEAIMCFQNSIEPWIWVIAYVYILY